MQTLLRQLIEATAAKDKELVESLIHTLLDLQPEDDSTHLMASHIYNWLGKKEQAYQHAAIAIALNPQAPAGYTWLAILSSKTVSRRTLQRILENGWQCSNQPFIEYVWASRSRKRRSHRHRQEIDSHVLAFQEKHKPPVA